MADQKDIDATIDKLHAAGATDEEVTSLIREKYGKPFDVQAQNATMRANMAKQADAGKPDTLADFATSGPMGDVMTGLNAGHEGHYAKAAHNIFMGISKVAAPAALPLIAAAPVAAIGSAVAGGVGSMAARYGTKMATDNPDAADLAGDIGGVVAAPFGAAASEAPTRAALRFAGEQLAEPEGFKQMAGRALLKLATPADTVPASITEAQARSASLNESDALVAKELARQQLEAGRANKVADAVRAEQAPTPAELGVTSVANASSSNPGIARATDAQPYVASPDQVNPHDAVRDMVVPTADAAASMPSATAAVSRRPYTPATPDSPLAKMREALGLRLDRPNDQVLLGEIAEPDPNPNRVPTPTFLQDGMGGRGQESVVKGPAALSDTMTVPGSTAATRGLEATLTPEERALIGNRSAGSLTIAERKALLDQLLKRAGDQ